MAPRPNDGLCFKCGRPGHRARDCRQDQKQLALPSTGRGYNQPRNFNARLHQLTVVVKPTMLMLMKLLLSLPS